jgi:transcription elongation GreA/GreB family factor
VEKIRHQLYQLCREHVRRQIEVAQSAIEQLQQDVNEETKSTAGDKYETGRAMMHLEMEKYSRQLSEALRSRQVLEKIDPAISHPDAHAGSLVRTDQGNYFLAISAGQYRIDDEVYITLSPSSPLGSRLMKTKAGDAFTFNNRDHKVLQVY